MTNEMTTATMPLATMANNNLMSITDPAIMAAAETSKQRIQAAYQVALFNRRDIEQVRASALKLCAIPRFAEQFVSYKPIGNTRVQVDSIRAMEGMASVYGNLQSDCQVTYADDSTHREKCFVTDLETNMTYSDEFTLKKTVERKSKAGREVIAERLNTSGDKVYIVKATEDEMLVKINAMKSKTMRNLLHRIIPPWLIEECRDKAQDTIRKGVKDDPESAKRKILDAFGQIGVTPADLAKYIGHTLASITPSEVIDLREVYSSVKSGEASFWEFLKSKTQAADAETEKKKESKFEKALKEKKPAAAPAPAPETKQAAEPTDLEKLAKLIEEKGAPVTAEQVKTYVEDKGEMFSFDMVAPNLNRIAGAIVSGDGEEK